MSEIGDIYGQYSESLNLSIEDFTTDRRNALDALRELLI